MKRNSFLKYFIIGMIINVFTLSIGFDTNALCLAQEKKASQNLINKYIQKLNDRSFDEPAYQRSVAREQSAIILGHYKDTLAVIPLINVLANDDYNNVHKGAAYALGQIGDKRAIPILLIALNNNSIPVQAEAAVSLVHLGLGNDQKVVSKLEYIAQGKDENKWDLQGFRSNPAEVDLIQDQHAKEGWRIIAMQGLSEINTERTKAVIESLTYDPSEIIRQWAIRLSKK